MIEFQKSPSIEVIHSPFRDESHDLMVRATERQLAKTGSKISEYWDSFMQYGGLNVLMSAEMTNVPVFYESRDITGTPVRYMVRYKGVQIDRFFQPVDLFLFVKPEGDQNDHPSSMAVATYRGEKQRYSSLVAFIVLEDDATIFRTSFHFFHGKLVSLEQIGRSQSLFPALEQTDSVGFFNVQNIVSDENILKVEAGLRGGDPQRFHLYQNLDGQLVKTRNLRVADPLNSEVELVSITGDGTIYTSEPFSLPEAINHMANFQPATCS